MRIFLTGMALGLLLAGCNARGGIDGDRAAGYQAKIAAACKTAMEVAIYVPGIAPWIIGGCLSEAAIAKLALDPTGLEWLNGLIEKGRAAAR